MQSIIFKCALALIGALAAPFSLAQVVAPDILLKAVTLEVIAINRRDEDSQSGNLVPIAEQIEARILPLIDFARMTQGAMAHHWRLATPAQQEALISEFKTLLVRTYSSVLSDYRDQSYEFRRLRATTSNTEVTVKSWIKQPGTASRTIDYDMEKVASGWKVYDLKIEGVSLIAMYRESFAGKIRESGVDGLIKSLADKNGQGDTRSRSQQAQNFYVSAIFQSILLGRR